MRTNQMKRSALAVLAVTATLYGIAACNSVPVASQQAQIADTCAAIAAANLVIQNDASASPTLKADAVQAVDDTSSVCSNPAATYTTAEVAALTAALATLTAKNGTE